jgi:hypothetical protein
MLYLSTYARNITLHTNTLRDFIVRNCLKMGIYSGAIPASADAGVTGTLLCTITGEGATAKAKQKIRFTPAPGSANAAEWNITLNGVKYTFIDDGTPSVAEVCTGLYNLIRAAIGTTSITTPAGKLNIPGVYGAFTLTDNATSLDIEAATEGIAFDYSVSVTGAGAGTGSIATSTITADAYGLKFEAAGDVAAGIIEKLATQNWQGVNAADGVATHFRIYRDGDDQAVAQGTSNWRVQGQISTAGAELNFRSTTFFAADTTTVSNDFKLEWPASRT